MNEVAVSVIIPTWRRSACLLKTLARVAECDPRPQEVLIHIDVDDNETAAALVDSPLPVRTFQSETRLGPGGGRNRLLREAACEAVVSLDDDSYPVCVDFFRQVVELLDAHPGFALLALPCLMPGQPPPEARPGVREFVAFEGCGAILRRSVLLTVPGYVPLRYAYGMEELDMALQLLDAGHVIGRVDRPCVQHDLVIANHIRPRVNAAYIVNMALLPFLRFPWPYVLLLPVRVLRRVAYSIGQHRYRGIGAGIFGIPAALWRSRRLRRPVKRSTMKRYLQLRADAVHRAAPGPDPQTTEPAR